MLEEKRKAGILCCLQETKIKGLDINMGLTEDKLLTSAVNIIEIISPIINDRIASIDIGRTTILYNLNNNVKRTISKILSFRVKTLKKLDAQWRFRDLAQGRQIWRGVILFS